MENNEDLTANDRFISLAPKKGGVFKKLKSGNLFKLVFPKVATMALNLIQIGPRVILRSTFQLLRTNIWTRLLSTILLVFFDLYSYLRGRISRKQLFINIVLSFSLLIGGTVGWTAGTSGALLIVAENTLLFIIAGIVGAGLASAGFDRISRQVLNRFLSSDMEDVLIVINEEFVQIAEEHELSHDEVYNVAKTIKIDEEICLRCFTKSDSDKKKYIRKFLKPYFSKLDHKREGLK